MITTKKRYDQDVARAAKRLERARKDRELLKAHSRQIKELTGTVDTYKDIVQNVLKNVVELAQTVERIERDVSGLAPEIEKIMKVKGYYIREEEKNDKG